MDTTMPSSTPTAVAAVILAVAGIGDTVIRWGAIAGAITAIIALAGAVTYGARRAIRWWRHEVVRIRAAIVDDVVRIVKPELLQLRPNGGRSLRDAVDRIEQTGQDTAALLAEHTAVSAGDRADLRARLEGSCTDLADLRGWLEELDPDRDARRDQND